MDYIKQLHQAKSQLDEIFTTYSKSKERFDMEFVLKNYDDVKISEDVKKTDNQFASLYCRVVKLYDMKIHKLGLGRILDLVVVVLVFALLVTLVLPIVNIPPIVVFLVFICVGVYCSCIYYIRKNESKDVDELVHLIDDISIEVSNYTIYIDGVLNKKGE